MENPNNAHIKTMTKLFPFGSKSVWRRRVAARQATSTIDLEDVTKANCGAAWTASHDKEMRFQTDKLEDRLIENRVANAILPHEDSADLQAKAKARATKITSLQLARERAEVRVTVRCKARHLCFNQKIDSSDL